MQKLISLTLYFLVGLNLKTFRGPSLTTVEAELLISGITRAMLHSFIWDTIADCLLPPYRPVKDMVVRIMLQQWILSLGIQVSLNAQSCTSVTDS